MKPFIAGFLLMALPSFGQVAMMALDDIPGTTEVCVTNWGPFIVTGLSDKATTQFVNQAVAPLSARLDAVDTALDDGTNNWNTAYGWGDHALAGYLLPAALAPYATTQQVAAAVAPLASHTNRTDNPHGVTAAQIGALTNELDLAALRTFHYGSPDIVESPAGWFVFDSAGTITGFNWVEGRTNVVIPWAIGGVPVTAIGRDAFRASAVVSLIAPQTVTSIENLVFYNCTSLASVSLPQAQTIGIYAFSDCTSLASVSLPQVQTIGDGAFGFCASLASVSLPQVQTVGNFAFSGCYSLASVSLPQAQTVGYGAFYYCDSLTSVSLPQVQTVGDYAFNGCASLASVSLPQVQTFGDYAFYACYLLTSLYFDNDAPAIGTEIFEGLNPNQVTIYVTNPHAKGWGATLGDMPVVRLPLYASAVYQAGELVATTGHVAQAIAEIPTPDLSDRPTFSQIAASNALPYTAWTGTITPANGTATVAIAHGNMPVLVTAAPCVLTLDPTGYGTAGVSRVSLSYYPGTNSFTFATNIIKYAETPSVDTNGWNTLLIRRVSNSNWNGVGL